MKTILIYTSILATAAVCNAATVGVSNLADPASISRLLFDTSGSQLGSGYMAIGSFTSLNSGTFATSTGAEIESDFNILGSPTSSLTNSTAAPGFLLAGVMEFAASGDIPSGSSFIGQDAYLLVGNGASLSVSTEAFIYLLGFTYIEDAANPPIAIDLSVDDPVGSVSLGINNFTGGVIFTSNTGGEDGNAPAITNGYQTLVLVPEPSTLLLSALGVLALLRRKR